MKRRNSNSNDSLKLPSRKRSKHLVDRDNKTNNDTFMTSEFTEQWSNEFDENKLNIVARNAITSSGAMEASTNINMENKVSHIFLNSIKPFHVKATNQGYSGRCWMFSGLNIFRYMIINSLNAHDFEFSQTYLFFWDKFERSNSIIQWYIDNPGKEYDDRLSKIMSGQFLDDGGYWNYFTNLVKKYGFIPKSAMNETYPSWVSETMNTILKRQSMSCVAHIKRLQKRRNTTREMIMNAKNETMKQIYHSLIKFLGKPPETFDWYYETNTGESNCIPDLTPASFSDLILKHIDLDDFVVLSNIPHKDRPYYQTYEIPESNNVQGGDHLKMMNVPIEEMKKAAALSILAKIPVWFAGDVSRGFNPYKSALDENLFDYDEMFGPNHETSKEDKINCGLTEGNHAMTLVGVNFGKDDKPNRWQVENSWGYYDHQVPGMDGFLSMSDEWFSDNLVQIAVNKRCLTPYMKRCLKAEPIRLQMWDNMAPAMKVVSIKKPDNLLKRAEERFDQAKKK
jgi:bleomycin hydrolase